MARPWIMAFEGTLHHALSRGNGQKDIFYDDLDRHLFLKTNAEMSERFDRNVFA